MTVGRKDRVYRVVCSGAELRTIEHVLGHVLSTPSILSVVLPGRVQLKNGLNAAHRVKEALRAPFVPLPPNLPKRPPSPKKKA